MKSKILITAAMLAASLAARADIILTFPEVNGPEETSGFPLPLTPIATDTYTIPAGQTITGATISGVFGETSTYYGSTAEFDLYANADEVISTYDVSPDPYNNVVPFSVSWSDLASLDTGSITLGYVQETDYDVRLSAVTIDISTAPTATGNVPDATGISSLVMAGLGLVGFGRRLAGKA
jgi:hypothetical protein